MTMQTTDDTNTILHIGLGSFHRAHQAVYLHALRESGSRDWFIVGGTIRDEMADTLAALQAQGGTYTMETVDPDGVRRYERIKSIHEVIPFDPALARMTEVGAADTTGIISFTVTEAGYYLDVRHRLDPQQHPDLAADLADGGCRTLYGALTAILRARMARGGAPVTLLNCDNLRSNGTRLRDALSEFLLLRGETALQAWVGANTRCPCAMVDRITPRPPPELADRVRDATGWDDRAPVMGEDFIQWVIEDDFIAGRPAWERVGVQMVESVHAFEEAKIRVLNASHSCIAWAGSLLGLQFIHEGMAVPAIRQMAWDYVTNDVIPCLHGDEHPSPIDLAQYRDVVLRRFGNAHVRDTNQRVAMDGYSKIPGFVVPTLRERIAAGAPCDSTAMLPALFFAFLQRWHQGTLAFDYADGAMDADAVHAMFDAPDPLDAYCRDPVLWGPLAGNAALASSIRQSTQRLAVLLAA